VLSGEATNTNSIVIGWTCSGLELIIYHTRDEHVNHNTIGAASDMVKVAEVMRQHQILVYPIIICEQFDVIVNIHRSFKGDDKI
jgi:hypothetical protein